jgi:superfamily II DNA/RNA helicase
MWHRDAWLVCRVSDLARLSLSSPEFVAVHAEALEATPQRLKQVYVTCPLQGKLDLLWFFIKTHQKKRVIAFLATCKQVYSSNLCCSLSGRLVALSICIAGRRVCIGAPED